MTNSNLSSTVPTPEKIRDMLYGLDTLVELEDGTKTPAIGLDNGATTPPFKSVIQEINEKLCLYGSIGRGAGQKSAYSSEIYEQGRKTVKKFVGLDPENTDYTVIYTNHTTDGMNKLASALIEDERKNFSVISTRMEHHANDLPWREHVGIERMLYAEVDNLGRLKISDIERFLAENKTVKYVAVTAASNVTGYVNDVHTIAKIAHAYGAKIIVDGAQIVAHRAFSMLKRPGNVKLTDPEESIDFFVFSAHKMYSPFGGGVIVGLSEILDKHIPCFYGGGMVNSVYDYNVDFTSPPDLYEAGSPNYPGVVGMLKAIEILSGEIGFDYIQKHEQELLKLAIDGLSKIPGVKLYADNENYTDRVGTIVFNIDGLSDTFVAETLAAKSAIAVRHRKFCAHTYVRRLLGNYPFSTTANPCTQDGMVRASFGVYTDKDDIKVLIKTVGKIALGELAMTEKLDRAAALAKRGLRLPNDRG